MINIISQPLGIASNSDPIEPPIPLSDCFRFCLQPDDADVILTPGVKANIVFVIPATCTVPADGTAFKIWGNDFTIESATDFSATSFKVATSGLLTTLNLVNMFQANVFFKRAGTVTAVPVGATFEVTFTWNDCREQNNFTGGNMNLTVFTTIGGSATKTDGVSPVYVEAFRVICNTVRYQDGTDNYDDLGALVGLEVEKLCDEVGVVCIDIQPDIEADLYTIMPELSASSFISSIDNGRSMMRFFSLQFGWTYRDNCVAKSGTITRGNRILALNAAFDVDDPYQMRRYWHGHQGGLPPGQSVVDYLTTQPKSITLCEDSYKWLWLLNAWQDDWPEYALTAYFTFYGDTPISSFWVVINNPATDGSAHYQPVSFNVSPSYIRDTLGISLNGITGYEVAVFGTDPLDGSDIWFNATEYLKFDLCKDCCGDSTDIYFLSPTGGIDTMLVRLDEIETLQSGGEEIRTNIPCTTNRKQRAINGERNLVATRVYQKVKLSVKIPRSADWERWVKHLRQSPQRWLRVKDESGAYIAKKIIFEAGAITQQKTGEGVTVEMVGLLQDIPTQAANNKPL